MKNISIVVTLFSLSLFTFACSNEIDLTAAAKEIPVVYGLLSRADSAQYLRIEKAFIDPEKSAIVLAQDPNQLYYSDVTVELVDKNNKSYKLNRVDGAKEGYPRKAGAFATTPNYLYKIKTSAIPLAPNEVYKLLVKKADGVILTETQTIILPDMTIDEDRTPSTDFSVANGFSIGWKQNNFNTAKFYDVILYLNVEERLVSSTQWIPKKLRWQVATSFIPNNTERIPGIGGIVFKQKEGAAFYRFLAENLDVTKPFARKLVSLDVEVISGGETLFDYINVGQINTGITGTEVLPTFSNVKNGYGILSSRNRFIHKDIFLNNRSIDSLKNGRFTKNLKFQ